MAPELKVVNLTSKGSKKLESLIDKIHEECPAQIQSRYISRIEAYKDQFPIDIQEDFWNGSSPMVIGNLPRFENIEKTKVLVLSIGEAIGKCAAYSEYNQSYITDIRPTPFSKELSSGTELLGMHNDLAFATDKCRPAALALVPHIAKGNIPKTLLAKVEEILPLLPAEEKIILSQEIFEIRSGGKLRWPSEQVRRISILYEDKAGRKCIRLSFDNINPIASLDKATADRAVAALKHVADIALEIGQRKGHVIQKGQSLLIPNDFAVHGRDVFEDPESERLLLRSYVIRKETALLQNGNTMLSLLP